MRPYGALWVLTSLYASLRIAMGLNGFFGVLIGHYASLCVLVGPFWSFCVLMVSYGPIRGIWILMAPYALYLIGPYPS